MTPPPAVLLHGFPQTSHQWRHLAPVLRADRTVLTPDWLDASCPVPVSREWLASQVLDCVDALGAERVDLVGHDWGGAIAFKFALMHPRRVRRLVLVDTALTRSVVRAMGHLLWFKVPGLAEATFGEGAGDFVRMALVSLCRTPGALSASDLDHYAAAFSDPLVHRVAISLYRDALGVYRVNDSRCEPVGVDEITAAWHAGPGNHPLWSETVDLSPDERQRTLPDVPALWVYGTGSGRPNREFRAQFEHAFPDLQVLELDCGHWVPEERPTELAKAVTDFLRQERPTRRSLPKPN